jgi:hypothetical protein
MQSTVSAVSAAEKWAIGGGKTTPHLPTTSGGGDWMVLGKQLQRMVSLRLQDAEGTASSPSPPPRAKHSLKEPSMTLIHITLTGVISQSAR